MAVNVLDSRIFSLTQSNTLSEGLCFQPGLRMETDCQTCNYTQPATGSKTSANHV